MATRRNTAILAPAPHRLSKQASAVLDLAAAAAEAAAEAAPPSLYSSPVFHGYSLWLCPAGEDLAALSSLIQARFSTPARAARLESLTPSRLRSRLAFCRARRGAAARPGSCRT
jgi:hypothetical protein